MKKFAPATQRNRKPIAAVLARELPENGLVLEIASGSGEHALYLAARHAKLAWQPTDFDGEALASIGAWSDEAHLTNILPPLQLDASSAQWPVPQADAIFCANLIHISPPAAGEGLLAGAGRVLGKGAPLILYGPFIEPDVETAPSNMSFDESLKSRNPAWGIREIGWVDELAHKAGMRRTMRYAMPANNLILVYRKQ